MAKFNKVLLVLAALGVAAAAVATETITYTYDARGRLVKVERSGSVNNNVTAEYKYDKADNRTNVNVVSPNRRLERRCDDARTRRRRALVAAARAAALLAAAPARAQTFPRVISPLRVESDQNGVNLVNGKTTIELPVLSVPAAPNLRFDRVQNAAPYVGGHVSGQAGEIPVGNWTVHTGAGSAESFECTDCWIAPASPAGIDFPAPRTRRRDSYLQQAGIGRDLDFSLHATRPGRLDPPAYLRQQSPIRTARPSPTPTIRPPAALGLTFHRPPDDHQQSRLSTSRSPIRAATSTATRRWGRPRRGHARRRRAAGGPARAG